MFDSARQNAEAMDEYWRYREPYLQMFFVKAAEEMQLSRAHTLLDIACGSGALAFGFAPFVGSITGIDIDNKVLNAARTEARRRKLDINFLHVDIGDLPIDGIKFDVATIGRAHSYLPRETTLARLNDLVSARGKVVVCGSTTADTLSGLWASAFRAAGRRWGRRRAALSHRQFMAGSAFTYEKNFIMRRAMRVSVDDLLLRALGYSRLMPEAVGQRREQYLDDVRSALVPYAVDGMLSEVIQTTGSIFGRAIDDGSASSANGPS